MGITTSVSYKSNYATTYFHGHLYSKQVNIGRYLQTGYFSFPDRIVTTKWTQVIAFRVDMWQNFTYVATSGNDSHAIIVSRSEDVSSVDLPDGFIPRDAVEPF